MATAGWLLSADGALAAAARVVSVSPSSGAAGTTVVVTINAGCALSGSVIFGSQEVSAALGYDPDTYVTLTAVAPAGTGTVDVSAKFVSCTTPNPTYTANADGHTFTYTGGGAPSDSQNLKSLQNSVTKSTAAMSTQIVTGAVGGAISSAFNGGTPFSLNSGGVSINFAATPKSDIEERTDHAFEALAYAGKERKPVFKAPKFAPEREWSAWMDLRGTGWQNHSANVGMNGAQFNATAGIGRKLTPDLLVGVFAGYEYFKYNMAALSAEMKGNGGSVGPYLGWRMSPTLRFDAMLGYGRVSYSAASGTASGSFHGDRLFGSTGLTGTYTYGAYKLEPSASLYALWEKQNAWTDSLGTAQSDRKFSAGRTSLGGRVITPLEYGTYALSPYVGFYGDWRFSSDNAIATGGTTVVGIENGWSGRVTAGLGVTGKGGTSVAVGGELGGLGADYKIWSGNVRLSQPF